MKLSSFISVFAAVLTAHQASAFIPCTTDADCASLTCTGTLCDAAFCLGGACQPPRCVTGIEQCPVSLFHVGFGLQKLKKLFSERQIMEAGLEGGWGIEQDITSELMWYWQWICVPFPGISMLGDVKWEILNKVEPVPTSWLGTSIQNCVYELFDSLSWGMYSPSPRSSRRVLTRNSSHQI
jgi:hypothetical protein